MNRLRRWMRLRRRPPAAPGEPAPAPRPQWEPRGQDAARTEKLDVPRDPRMEALTALLLVLAGTCGAAFAVFYVIYGDTQLYGLTLGLGLAFLAAALVVAAKRVVPQETAVEEKETFGEHYEEHQLAITVRDGAKGISRRGLLGGAAAIAGAGIGAAAIVPAASLGPKVGDLLADSPWRRGRALVDEEGRPVGPDELVVGGFLTAFPQGASREAVGSPVILCRLRPEELRMPPERRTWTVAGIVAYSKVCTHAGCAIAMFRYPLYAPHEPAPGLVCPCHYSTFDPRDGATVRFGPASRPLPQLPLGLDAAGHFIATGPLSGPPGPSYDLVRLQHDR
jgi:ubiquinol-cytochrome c reductase iron-sulfur subunit